MSNVSVVIPTKDRLRFLRKTLPTYLAQPEVREIIVVVDGSTDGTQKYLQSMHAQHASRVIFLDNGVNRGIPYTKNRGIDAATSEYIFIAEDDLELEPGFFKTLFAHMRSSGADVICGRNVFRIEGESRAQVLRRVNAMDGPAINTRTIEINTSLQLPGDTFQPMSAASVLGKAEIFKQVRFDERYKVNFWREETDFQLSLQEAGYTLASCPHALSYNYMILNDRGGVRGVAGLKRVQWIVRNNWRFVKKHRAFIAEHFNIGNPYWYIAKFTVRKFVTDAIFPLLSPLKRSLQRAATRNRTV